MLVLSRKINERIQIGDGIEVAVLRVAGGRVKLGISAPDHITVRRKEVAEATDAAEDEAISRDSAGTGTWLAELDVA